MHFCGSKVQKVVGQVVRYAAPDDDPEEGYNVVKELPSGVAAKFNPPPN